MSAFLEFRDPRAHRRSVIIRMHDDDLEESQANRNSEYRIAREPAASVAPHLVSRKEGHGQAASRTLLTGSPCTVIARFLSQTAIGHTVLRDGRAVLE
eukprot:COSAG02_NODE_467_length_21771_cov_39.020303_9_plen_98_part_00